jgi:putative hydrolase of the HAD superfamily
VTSLPSKLAATVDIGGTIWPDRPAGSADQLRAELHQRLRACGVRAEHVGPLHEELGKRTAGVDDSEYFDVWDAIQHACVAVGIDGIAPEAIRHAACLPAAGRWKPFPGARGLLEDLREAGFRCVVVSNGVFRNGVDYRADFEALGFDDLIDDVISSVDTRWRKPNPHFFEAALEAATVPPSNCVMIGNSETKDIIPAAAVGMWTVRVAIEEPVPAASRANYVCDSLAEVRPVVRGLTTTIV